MLIPAAIPKAKRNEWADGLYSFTFVPSKADGKLTVKIADGGILGQFDIEIEQGIKKNTNFDI